MAVQTPEKTTPSGGVEVNTKVDSKGWSWKRRTFVVASIIAAGDYFFRDRFATNAQKLWETIIQPSNGEKVSLTKPLPPCVTDIYNTSPIEDSLQTCEEAREKKRVLDILFKITERATKDITNKGKVSQSLRDADSMQNSVEKKAADNGRKLTTIDRNLAQYKLNTERFEKFQPISGVGVENIAPVKLGYISYQIGDNATHTQQEGLWSYLVEYPDRRTLSVFAKGIMKDSSRVFGVHELQAINDERLMTIEAYKLAFARAGQNFSNSEMDKIVPLISTSEFLGYSMPSLGLNLASYINVLPFDQIGDLVAKGIGDHFEIAKRTGRISIDYILPNFVLSEQANNVNDVMVIDMSRSVALKNLNLNIFTETMLNCVNSILICYVQKGLSDKDLLQRVQVTLEALSTGITASQTIPQQYKNVALGIIKGWKG